MGLGTARAIQKRYPRLRVMVLDKEAEVGAHQSGHNSGVIHAGLYYKPGSLKAKLCLTGRQQLERYCTEHGVRFERCGKLVVAADREEEGRLMALAHRALQNGIHVRLLSPEQMKEYEPHVVGTAALHSPETGIADYPGLALALKAELQALGAQILTGAGVQAVTQSDVQVLHTSAGDVRARWIVTCAGLQADKVARLCGAQPDVQIVPFRGEYYDLVPERAGLVNNLIYPVPDPRFPFLGVHLTRMIGGGVEAGPNAVLAFAREGYRRSQFNPGELLETLAYPGFWRLARPLSQGRHLRDVPLADQGRVCPQPAAVGAGTHRRRSAARRLGRARPGPQPCRADRRRLCRSGNAARPACAQRAFTRRHRLFGDW